MGWGREVGRRSVKEGGESDKGNGEERKTKGGRREERGKLGGERFETTVSYPPGFLLAHSSMYM